MEKAEFSKLWTGEQSLPKKGEAVVYLFAGYPRKRGLISPMVVQYIGSTDWMGNRMSGHRARLSAINRDYDLHVAWIKTSGRSAAFRLERELQRVAEQANGDMAAILRHIDEQQPEPKAE